MPKLNWREGSPRFRSLKERMKICKRTSVTPNTLDCRYSPSLTMANLTSMTLAWSQSSMILVGDKSCSNSLPRDGLQLSLTVIFPTSFKILAKWMMVQMVAYELDVASTDSLAFLVMSCSDTHTIDRPNRWWDPDHDFHFPKYLQSYKSSFF